MLDFLLWAVSTWLDAVALLFVVVGVSIFLVLVAAVFRIVKGAKTSRRGRSGGGWVSDLAEGLGDAFD